jgi:hypothetical protein
MLPQVQALLDIIVGSAVNLMNANGAGRAFELLLMTEIAAELYSRGYIVYLLRSDGHAQLPGAHPITFVQRGGAPGGVRPGSQGTDGPTSIVFQRRAGLPEWEIWNGVEFVGRSGGTHEFDLAIVPKQLGDLLRAEPNGGRPFGHGWVLVECKDVATNGDLDEMRAFLARIYDTTLLNWHAQYLGATPPLHRIYALDPSQTGFGEVSTTYRIENTAVYHAIARRTGFTSGTAGMSDYYFIRRFDKIDVASPELNTFKVDLCDWIDQQLPTQL